MTIDEAIIYHIQKADSYHKAMPNYGEAADHRQLAEWLTDYKELKNSIGAVKLSNMKEALALIREYKAENEAQEKLIADYKRLLKSATNVLNMFIPCDEDYNCSECIRQRQSCNYDDSFKWRYLDEALKLIGGSEND